MGWIATVIKGGIGGVQMGMAMEELKSLPGSREYSLNQDLATATALARRGAQQGMTPEERAVAGQAIGTQQSRTQRAMEQRGLGNLAAAISQSSATDAFNQLEAANQQIKRDYLGKYGELGSKVQALENANVTSFNQQLAAQQRELGMAAQQGFAALGGTGAMLANAFDKEQIDKWKSQYDQRQAQKAQTELAQGEAQSSFSADLMGDNRQVGEPIFSGDTLESVESSPEYGMLSPETQTAISQGFSSGIDSSGFDASTMNMDLSSGFDTSAVEGMDFGTMDFSSVDMSGPVAGGAE
jgi:hypothetical protein